MSYTKQMTNKVFYGEYTLKHWIDLLLSKSILLPEYQRYFVWKESAVKWFIESLKKKQFVPPVTIASYCSGGVKNNLILDGQQRLTSLLLAFLSIYPDKEFYKANREQFARENDGDDDVEADAEDEMLNWTFNKILKYGNSWTDIQAQLPRDEYKAVSYDVDDAFFRDNYLGFSYLVQQGATDQQQKELFSQVFRNINIKGTPLDPMESREALYFLDSQLVGLFKPDFVQNVKIVTNKEFKLDFVRILSLLSQRAKDGDSHCVARGYKTHIEDYYELYLNATVDDSNATFFKKFSDVFANREYERQLAILKSNCEVLGYIGKSYPSIIDADMDWFGLVNGSLYQGKVIDETRKDELRTTIYSQCERIKTPAHKRSPGALKYIRERMDNSIDVYSAFWK